MSALLRRIWWPGRPRRPQTVAGLFARADRCRRQGRAAAAARLVSAGLEREPNSLTGHLLAAYLHLAARTIEPARREFRWVLDRHPGHPRALLGLARLALEENDLESCRASLTQALGFYPDFPEAEALRGALATRRSSAAPLSPSPRLERLRLPALARALVVLGADGEVVGVRPADVKADGDRIARVLSLAAATLGRVGAGALRRGILEDGEETFFMRCDTALTVALALPRTIHITQGLLEVNRLWAAARHEFAVSAESPPVESAGAAARPRRVS